MTLLIVLLQIIEEMDIAERDNIYAQLLERAAEETPEEE